jgi:WD40 repeat protein
MQKAALIAPVTALAVVSTGPRSSATVYAARGNELLTFTRSTLNASHTLTVFDHHNVHGINACQDARGGELVLVHGDKAVALCCTHAATSETEVRCRLRRLDDMVLATCWATVGGCEQLFVGYAHNFLDVFAVKAEVVSGRAAPRLLRRVTAQDNCCLFSMSIVPEATRVVVVGGTAFGPIYLWASHEEELRSDPSSHMCIEGHEGVVFRALWSADRSLLASVSDDRSVRLWDMREGDTRGTSCSSAGDTSVACGTCPFCPLAPAIDT